MNPTADKPSQSALTLSANSAVGAPKKNKGPSGPNFYGKNVSKRPKRSRLLQWITKWMGRGFGLYGLPILKLIPLINQIPFVRGVIGVKRVHIDEADQAQLDEAYSSRHATFLAPNHPEIFGDFLMDWEMACRFSDKTWFWAGPDLVLGPLKHIWLRHGLIANTRDGKGKTLSVERAVDGDNVLMHAEGDVHWTRDTVHGLYAGVAQLACRAADESGEEVWVQPIAYKSAFAEPTDKALHEEMRFIERRLKLPRGDKLSVAERFAALRLNLLIGRRAFFGLPERDITAENFAVEHGRFFEELLLMAGVGPDEGKQGPMAGPVGEGAFRLQLRERVRLAQKKLRSKPAGFADWQLMAWELRRLYGEHNATYHQPQLRAEHVAESLKRIKEQLCVGKLTDPLRSLLPMTAARRIVLVKAPAPVVVTPDPGADQDARQRRLLEEVWTALQRQVDQMDERLNELVDPVMHDNPLAAPADEVSAPGNVVRLPMPKVTGAYASHG
jgi:hypothetical protein